MIEIAVVFIMRPARNASFIVASMWNGVRFVVVVLSVALVNWLMVFCLGD